MKILALAIKQANIANTPKTLEEDRKKVREELAKIRIFLPSPAPMARLPSSIWSTVSMSARRSKRGTLIQIQNGQFVPVGEGRAAALKLR